MVALRKKNSGRLAGGAAAGHTDGSVRCEHSSRSGRFSTYQATSDREIPVTEYLSYKLLYPLSAVL